MVSPIYIAKTSISRDPWYIYIHTYITLRYVTLRYITYIHTCIHVYMYTCTVWHSTSSIGVPKCRLRPHQFQWFSVISPDRYPLGFLTIDPKLCPPVIKHGVLENTRGRSFIAGRIIELNVFVHWHMWFPLGIGYPLVICYIAIENGL